MKIEIEIGDEMERMVVTRALKWHYGCCDSEKFRIKEDRKYNKRLRKAIEVVLEAWMTPEEYVEWKDE